MKIKRENVVVWILGMIVLGILAALGWRIWQKFQGSVMSCYLRSSALPQRSTSHTSLGEKYRERGIISEAAFEKLNRTDDHRA